MAAEAKREPGPLRQWLQKLRESWRRAGDMGDRAAATRRDDYQKAERHGGPRSGDPGAGTGTGF
jgi:hypothetical protein